MFDGGRQRLRVETLAKGDQPPEFESADRLRAGHVGDADDIGDEQLEQRRREVGDVHRAANVAGVEDTRFTGRQPSDALFLPGATVRSDDNRRPRDDRARPDRQDRRPYGVIGQGNSCSVYAASRGPKTASLDTNTRRAPSASSATLTAPSAVAAQSSCL
jgi:hypothetical protein